MLIADQHANDRANGSQPGPHGLEARTRDRVREAISEHGPLTAAALAGLLRPMLEDVNVVSAPIVAKERGVMVEETTREAEGDYESVMTVTV